MTLEEKESEYISDDGLNLSLQVFVSYESLYEFFKNISNIRTFQTVIMYNGEVAMFGKQNDKLSRMTTIMGISGEEIYVSSKDDYKKLSSSL